MAIGCLSCWNASGEGEEEEKIVPAFKTESVDKQATALHMSLRVIMHSTQP